MARPLSDSMGALSRSAVLTLLKIYTFPSFGPRLAPTLAFHDFPGSTQPHPLPRLSPFSSEQGRTGMQITLWIHRPIDEGSTLKKSGLTPQPITDPLWP